VVVAGRRRQAGETLAKSFGSGALFIATDVTRASDIEALVERTLERFGGSVA